MKSLIVAATMLVSGSVFATTAVFHDYDQVLGAIKLNNACITDSTVNSINDVNVCTKLVAVTTGNPNSEAGSQTDWKCVSYETKALSYSRTFQKSICLKYAPVSEASSGECLKFGTKTVTMPATIKVRTEVTANNEAGTISSKTEMFSFPTCN